MPQLYKAILAASISVSFALPSAALAMDARPAFAIKIMQGANAMQPQAGVVNVTRAEPFELSVQAPARTVLLVNVAGTSSKQPVFEQANVNAAAFRDGYALLSDSSEYIWYRFPEKTANKRKVLRKRWVNQTVEGFNVVAGNHWKLGTYILDENLTFTVAAVPVDAKGNPVFTGKIVMSSVQIKLGAPSQDDDCRLMQNIYRNFGEEPPSCEELMKQ